MDGAHRSSGSRSPRGSSSGPRGSSSSSPAPGALRKTSTKTVHYAKETDSDHERQSPRHSAQSVRFNKRVSNDGLQEGRENVFKSPTDWWTPTDVARSSTSSVVSPGGESADRGSFINRRSRQASLFAAVSAKSINVSEAQSEVWENIEREDAVIDDLERKTEEFVTRLSSASSLNAQDKVQAFAESISADRQVLEDEYTTVEQEIAARKSEINLLEDKRKNTGTLLHQLAQFAPMSSEKSLSPKSPPRMTQAGKKVLQSLRTQRTVNDKGKGNPQMDLLFFCRNLAKQVEATQNSYARAPSEESSKNGSADEEEDGGEALENRPELQERKKRVPPRTAKALQKELDTHQKESEASKAGFDLRLLEKDREVEAANDQYDGVRRELVEMQSELQQSQRHGLDADQQLELARRQIDQQLASSEHIEQRWQDTQRQVDEANGHVAVLRQAMVRKDDELTAAELAKADHETTREELELRVKDLERQILTEQEISESLRQEMAEGDVRMHRGDTMVSRVSTFKDVGGDVEVRLRHSQLQVENLQMAVKERERTIISQRFILAVRRLMHDRLRNKYERILINTDNFELLRQEMDRKKHHVAAKKLVLAARQMLQECLRYSKKDTQKPAETVLQLRCGLEVANHKLADLFQELDIAQRRASMNSAFKRYPYPDASTSQSPERQNYDLEDAQRRMSSHSPARSVQDDSDPFRLTQLTDLTDMTLLPQQLSALADLNARMTPAPNSPVQSPMHHFEQQPRVAHAGSAHSPIKAAHDVDASYKHVASMPLMANGTHGHVLSNSFTQSKQDAVDALEAVSRTVGAMENAAAIQNGRNEYDPGEVDVFTGLPQPASTPISPSSVPYAMQAALRVSPPMAGAVHSIGTAERESRGRSPPAPPPHAHICGQAPSVASQFTDVSRMPSQPPQIHVEPVPVQPNGSMAWSPRPLAVGVGCASAVEQRRAMPMPLTGSIRGPAMPGACPVPMQSGPNSLAGSCRAPVSASVSPQNASAWGARADLSPLPGRGGPPSIASPVPGSCRPSPAPSPLQGSARAPVGYPVQHPPPGAMQFVTGSRSSSPSAQMRSNQPQPQLWVPIMPNPIGPAGPPLTPALPPNRGLYSPCAPPPNALSPISPHAPQFVQDHHLQQMPPPAGQHSPSNQQKAPPRACLPVRGPAQPMSTVRSRGCSGDGLASPQVPPPSIEQSPSSSTAVSTTCYPNVEPVAAYPKDQLYTY